MSDQRRGDGVVLPAESHAEEANLQSVYSISDFAARVHKHINDLEHGPIGISARGHLIAILSRYDGEPMSVNSRGHRFLRYADVMAIATEVKNAAIETTDVRSAETMDYLIELVNERLLGAGGRGAGGD